MCSENFLTVETKSGLMDVYVASPETQDKVPVVLVFQEAFGVNTHIRSVCDRLAKEGFLAAAPDLFHRFGRKIIIPYADKREVMPLLSKMKNEDIIEDAEDTIRFLHDLPSADTARLGSMGFCIGGFASALCATRLPIRKMISFYGAGIVRPREGIGLMPFLQDLRDIKGSCLFFFGGKDASIPQTDIKQIEKELCTHEIPFEVDIFENSDHGFFCEERKPYNQVDASMAWKKSLSFLR